MTEMLTAISTVGFPIVMCGIMCYYIFTIQTKTNEIIGENTSTLTRLTTLIERLLDRLDDEEDTRRQ